MKKRMLFLLVCFACALLGVIIGIVFQKDYDEYLEHPGISIFSRIDTGIIPEDGFVPDKETALKIAKTVWLPIYGKKNLMWRIYQVKLVDDIWYIEGANKIHLFFGIHGGGPFIKIDKIKGTILDVSYTG